MKSVVLCGSKKFKPEIRAFAGELKKHDIIVYEPHLHSGKEEWQKMSDEYKRFVLMGLTYDHFYKIQLADIVYLYNKDGYAGVSTTLEIGYATALGKPIYALHPDPEGCRDILIREIITSSAELLKRLQ